jgi:3-methyl-2-oxobutanoate hydroxymethyltransferase
MLFVTTPDEAAAASAAGIHMLSNEGRFFDATMREAAGNCFVQVGLPYGGWGTFNGRALGTAEDYMREPMKRQHSGVIKTGRNWRVRCRA